MKRFAAQLALWLGLAAIGISSVQLTHWPYVVASVKDVVDVRGFDLYDFEHAFPLGEEVLGFGLQLLVFLLTLGTALVLAFSFLKANRTAEWLVVAGLGLAAILARVIASPGAMARHPAAFTVASWFFAALICIVAVWASWSVSNTLGARVVTITVALVLAAWCASQFEPGPGPLWTADDFDAWLDAHTEHPWLSVIALSVLGFVSGIVLRAEVNLRAVALVCAVGLLMLPRAVAIRRDAFAYRPTDHAGIAGLDVHFDSKYARAPRCRARTVSLAPLVIVRDHNVITSGMLIARTTDPSGFRVELAEKLREIAVAGEFAPEPLERLLLFAELDTPLPVVAEILAGARAAGITNVEVVNVQFEPAAWRAMRATHRHVCVATFELTEAGTPASSFADWAAFVEAIDAPEVPLQIGPR